VRIGSRGSMLAKWQAQHIAELLNALGVSTEIAYIKTSGDRFQNAGINQIGVKGVFIKEIEDALLDRRVDIAVHSMKDVPTETPRGLEFPAICKRENPHDCLVSRGGVKFADLPSGARVGTSSLRRQAQLRHARADLKFLELRGNVDTRLQKLESGEYDAIVLAKAGLDRLGWSARITEVLSADVCVPAVGQGALGIEARKDDHEIIGLIRKLDHAHTRAEITAERALLHELQGGCQVPLGALARADGEAMTITACIASMDGKQTVTRMIAGPIIKAEALGYQLAKQMIAGGAEGILKQTRSSVAGETGN
jgi:hydroxymethylbilane synthase